MSSIPEDLKYTAEHEWLKAEGDTHLVGITDFAQASLGDIVFVQLPEIGREVAKGESLGEIESTKSVSEIYAPVSGKVTAINERLDTEPELVNTEPYGDGWLVRIQAGDVGDGLLDAAAYKQLTEDE
jgi:glycine cleavage system H protein